MTDQPAPAPKPQEKPMSSEMVAVIARALAAKQIDSVNERVGLGLMSIGKDCRDAMIERDYPGWIDEAKYVADALIRQQAEARATSGAGVPDGCELISSKADEHCGCPEEEWETPWGYLFVHLNAGEPTDVCLDLGDDGQLEAQLTAATVDAARTAAFSWASVAALLSAFPTEAPGSHADDRAVDVFAARMKTKLARAREKGRGGWDDPAQCSPEKLSAMLHEHVAKGDPVDVANFAMMIEHYGASITATEAPGSEGAGGGELALAAAECSALICEHAVRLGLDAFAAATIARAVIARIHKIAETTNVH